MFCPRCRRHWESDEAPLLLPSGQSRSSRTCPVCHILLAPDRLSAEFPASETTAVSSNVTVQDLLRETTTSALVGSQTPLDEQVKRFRKSFWEHDHDTTPGATASPLRRWRFKAPSLDTALGFGTIAAIVMIVVGIFIYTIWQGARGQRPRAFNLATDISRPQVTPVALSGQSMARDLFPAMDTAVQASSQQARSNWLPTAIGEWRLWKNAGERKAPNGDPTLAYYQQGRETVALSLIAAPKSQGFLAHPAELLAGAPRMISTPQRMSSIRPREDEWHGADCLFFDYQTNLASWRIFTDNLYLPDSPHTVSWYKSPYVVTVGANTAHIRNKFAISYMAALGR